MIVSTRHGFVFIGINKTGTTSVESVLRPYRNRFYLKYLKLKFRYRYGDRRAFKHVPATIARDLVGPRVWDRSFTFTFVRNPWARVVSEYTKHRHDPNSGLSLKEGFTRWVCNGGNWLARENTMTDFVSDDEGREIVDYIGRIEDSGRSFKDICQQIGIPPVELPKLNRSANPYAYRDMYSPQTREIVDAWVGQDAERFGYRF